MQLKPEQHANEYHYGRAPDGQAAGFGPLIVVEVADESHAVELILDPLPCETFDDHDVTRYLTPDEARDLAAMLWHKADMADRRAGIR